MHWKEVLQRITTRLTNVNCLKVTLHVSTTVPTLHSGQFTLLTKYQYIKPNQIVTHPQNYFF